MMKNNGNISTKIPYSFNEYTRYVQCGCTIPYHTIPYHTIPVFWSIGTMRMHRFKCICSPSAGGKHDGGIYEWYDVRKLPMKVLAEYSSVNGLALTADLRRSGTSAGVAITVLLLSWWFSKLWYKNTTFTYNNGPLGKARSSNEAWVLITHIDQLNRACRWRCSEKARVRNITIIYQINKSSQVPIPYHTIPYYTIPTLVGAEYLGDDGFVFNGIKGASGVHEYTADSQ